MNKPLPSMSEPTEVQDALASTLATPFAQPIITASKSKAQKQREYRQRIKASRTPAQAAAARKLKNERQRKNRLRQATKVSSCSQVAIASNSLETTERTTAARKTRAQIQREYRQRIAASKTPEQAAAAREARNERDRTNRLRQAANLLIASGSLEATTTSSSLSGQRFPRPDREERGKWVKFVQINRSENNWLPSHYSHICSLHFREEDKYITKEGRRYLKKSAIPCIDVTERRAPAAVPARVNALADRDSRDSGASCLRECTHTSMSKPEKWTDDTTCQFVSLYKKHECLWNVTLPEYKNKYNRDRALQAIQDEMAIQGFGANEIKNKIRSLRSTYYLEKKKIDKNKREGFSLYKPSLKWFHIMQYIMHTLAKQKFPQDPKIKEKWIDSTNRGPNWWPLERSTICSAHFEEKCFKPGKTSRRLFEWAVPTLRLQLVFAVIECLKNAMSREAKRKRIKRANQSAEQIAARIATQRLRTAEGRAHASQEQPDVQERFPNDSFIRAKWIAATGRVDWIPTKYSTICSAHFNENDYDIKASGKKYLLDGAIPHEKIVKIQFLPSSTSNQPTSQQQTDEEMLTQVKVEVESDDAASTGSEPDRPEIKSEICFSDYEITAPSTSAAEPPAKRQKTKIDDLNAKIDELKDIMLNNNDNDECLVFGKYIGFQLQKMTYETRTLCQLNIQKLCSEALLNQIQEGTSITVDVVHHMNN
ncbi:unnamed protein product [Colias eurytheme]|nr:unnamed protein product [Colias eurytheme]